jgi:HD-GYP domain-containing protein (c-di-GMP phosphodiesterase class II)
MDYIKSQSGKHFDPQLVKIFLDFLESKGLRYGNNRVYEEKVF